MAADLNLPSIHRPCPPTYISFILCPVEYTDQLSSQLVIKTTVYRRDVLSHTAGTGVTYHLLDDKLLPQVLP